MIVCLCRGLADHAIRATIARGGDTLERLAAICGAGRPARPTATVPTATSSASSATTAARRSAPKRATLQTTGNWGGRAAAVRLAAAATREAEAVRPAPARAAMQVPRVGRRAVAVQVAAAQAQLPAAVRGREAVRGAAAVQVLLP